MRLDIDFLTENDCYMQNKRITPKGIMVHSTATPGVTARDFQKRWNKSGVEKAVHTFVDDGVILQTLPWEVRGWHGGGSSNNTHIGLELCEPAGHSYSGSAMVGYDAEANREYFECVWRNAVDLTVYLCRMYNLTERDVLCHSEGFAEGIASNSADVMHWFPKHGRTMKDFRAAVRAGIVAAPFTKPRPVLRRGDSGQDVFDMQNRLIGIGFNLPKYGADANFGGETEGVLKDFQKARGLAVDGVCGPKTWAELGV